MHRHSITYVDFAGETRTEDFYFNISRAELIEMQYSIEGGMSAWLEKAISRQNHNDLMNFITDFILKSYGEKSADNRRFVKIDENGKPLSRFFEETDAYSELLMELGSDKDKLIAFINDVIPKVDEKGKTVVTASKA